MTRLLVAAAIVAGMLVSPREALAAAPESGNAFTFRLGGFSPSGDSDFWQANETAFTLEVSDFTGAIGGVGYSMSINNYLEFDANMDFYSAGDQSADSTYVDLDGYPILHDTTLWIYPLTAGIRVLPAGRYARRGAGGKRLVRRPVPYIGAGIGLSLWQYEEEGDFVATDLTIVYDRLTDSGTAFETHVYAGVEFPVSPEWYVTLEVRRSWAEASMGGDFESVNPGTLDLGGTAIYVGGRVRF